MLAQLLIESEQSFRQVGCDWEKGTVVDPSFQALYVPSSRIDLHWRTSRQNIHNHLFWSKRKKEIGSLYGQYFLFNVFTFLIY